MAGVSQASCHDERRYSLTLQQNKMRLAVFLASRSSRMTQERIFPVANIAAGGSPTALRRIYEWSLTEVGYCPRGDVASPFEEKFGDGRFQ